jgi:hypothetical protein
MKWGPDTTGPFLSVAGIFLVLSSAGLYVLRAQRKYSVIAAGVVGLAGLVLIFVAAIQ